MATLSSVFEPKSIALIGASDRQGSVGQIILTNLLKAKGRKIFPVNPNKKTLFTLKSYPDIGSVPEHVDLAVIATPAKGTPGVMEECGKAGVGGAVIISAGFRETGAEGALLEQQISDIRKRYAMRILGPNCLGFVRPDAGLNVTFVEDSPPPGNIAFISESASLSSTILSWASYAHVGFSMIASLGSMTDIGFGDLIDFLSEDWDTRSILIYMESVRNARKFMSAARAFALRKPIVVLKPGRFAEKAKAEGLSTWAPLADNDAVYEAAFKRAGVVRVKSIAGLFHTARVLDSKKMPGGPRLAIVTAAGLEFAYAGAGLMATDALIEFGGEPARLSPETIRILKNTLPPQWSEGNSVDVLGQTDTAGYTQAINACLNDPGVDGVLVIYVPMNIAGPEDVARAVIDSAKKTGKPIIAAWIGGAQVRKAREFLIANDIPTYSTPEEAVRSYINMFKYRINLDLLYETPAEMTERKAPSKEKLGRLIDQALAEGRSILTEKESAEFLDNYAIPSPPSRTAHTREEALRAAGEIGYPVILKVLSAHIPYRKDVGGVIAGISSEAEIEGAYEQMMKEVAERAPGLPIEGISLQKMIEGVDYKLILGSKRDKDFGSVIFFGMGGVNADLIRDFSIGLPPLNRTLAKRLMEETKAYKLIQGYRGKRPANLEALEEILVNFSYLLVDFPEIAEIDINPLVIAKGMPCARDVRIVLETISVEDRLYISYASKYQHLIITPYPTHLIENWKFKDGTEVVLRPIKPEDEPLTREFLSSLSEDTLRTRFFSATTRITHEWLVLLCDTDYDRHLAIVAEISENGRRRIIAVGSLHVDAEKNTGEFALLVHDAFQRKGLASKLLQLIIGYGREKGLNEIDGQIMSENDKMIGLARKLGFSKKWEQSGTQIVSLRLK
ncbi:MAG: Succinyl-CoA ligase (ADP-forming) subunit beta [Syntrophus sp. PtaU1.Bin208]|nr:MAG: Succinyl-CoA ligase (ADP-forming) subunit beta [Syntrophus sp. PtaU1.Bin208]